MITEALTKHDSSGFLEDEQNTLFDWFNNLFNKPKQFSFALENSKFTIDIPHSAPWFDIALQKLIDLEDLEDNWDSEGATPIDIDCIRTAIKLLAQITQNNTPEPYIFPTLQGGVQIEWSTKKVELEIEVINISTILVLFDKPNGEELEWEETIYENMPRLVNCIKQLI